MKPKIITIPKKRVIGMQSKMQNNDYGKIVELWKCFMPSKKKIKDTLSEELIAIQVYDDFFKINRPYNIWACAEVSKIEDIPDTMSSFIISEGKYAVFHHTGMDATALYQRIMTEWLPNSDFEIDNRPHFQVMGEKYKNGSPDSEEDFYVPVKSKNQP